MEVFWQRHPITFQKALPWFKIGRNLHKKFDTTGKVADHGTYRELSETSDLFKRMADHA
jgi:hypothetical protein